MTTITADVCFTTKGTRTTSLFALLIVLATHAVGFTDGVCHRKYVLRSGSLSCQEKEHIVSMHNEMRQSVALGSVRGQPPASNMLQMVWDEELARKAQQWADTCPSGHDSNGARGVSRFAVGQNMAFTWSSPQPNGVGERPEFASQIHAWFNEVHHYAFGSRTSSATGHYSQMVWGDSFLVGCGYTYLLDGNKYTKMYVCNYGPGGNVNGAKPYKPGKTSCEHIRGATPSRRYYGLCEIPGYRSSACYYGKK